MSYPSLRMPAAWPTPSRVRPFRSMVMPWAPTTRPSHKQSCRSLLTRMLCVTTIPQKTVVGTGAALIVQAKTAGVGSAFPAGSTARTW